MNDLSPDKKIILDRYLARTKDWEEQDNIFEKEVDVESTKINPQIIHPSNLSIDLLVRQGQSFHRTDKQGDLHVGVAYSLQDAQAHIQGGGVVASMPYLIAGKTHAVKKDPTGKIIGRDNNHIFWKNWHTAYSEENIGIDTNGMFVERGKPVIITVHGGGLLATPERIFQAYRDGLTSQHAARYVDSQDKPTGEFENLLRGILPNGDAIPIYSIEDVKKRKVIDPFGIFGVWNDYETAKKTESGRHNKDNFVNNELVIARAGTLEYLSQYFDLASFNGKVGNWHRLNKVDPKIPQGRVLCLGDAGGGLGGGYLDGGGRFVGVRTGGSP